MTDESKPVIGKGNYEFPCDLISVVSCPLSYLTAGNCGHSTASSCHFFTSLVIFGIFLKLLILNAFVFQYASSPSDCTMNLKGTKSREANKNNSSWTAIKTAEFLRDSHELGEGKEPSCVSVVCYLSVSDGLARACPKSAGVAGELPQERQEAVFCLWYIELGICIWKFIWKTFFQLSGLFFSREKLATTSWGLLVFRMIPSRKNWSSSAATIISFGNRWRYRNAGSQGERESLPIHPPSLSL